MAYERISDRKIPSAVKADSLDAFVSNLAQTFKNQMTIRNAEDELRFNEAVNSGDLSLDDQLQYRKDQLKRVSDDPSERRRVRGEIASLNKRIEEADFTDGYSSKLADFQAGILSIDNVIAFLNEQKDGTNNQEMISLIESKLVDAQQKKFSITQDLVKNTSDYAEKSKSVSVIDTQIAKVQTYRAQALLSDNDLLVSVYDLQLQGLSSAKNAAKVTNDVLNLGAISATGAFTAVAMLDAMNAKINGAGSTGPVKIGETTYASEKDFWTFKRDSYLTDQSSNGFFPSLNGEVKDKINTSNSKNTLDSASLSSLSSVFNTIASRPELANFQKQIDIYKQDALQTGANSIAQSVVNEFSRTLDINAAMSKLTALKSLGVNVDQAFTNILTSNAATKNAQVQGILSAAQTAMQNNPALTPEQAVAEAVKAGAGTVVSPTDAAGKTETTIASGAVKTAAAGAGVNDTRTTITPPATPNSAPTEPANTPQPSGNISFATIAGLPNLTPGMKSEDVRTLQNFLVQQGFAIPSGATGLYGPETQAAVAAFQDKNKIDTAGNPGFFGPRTKSFISTNNVPAASAPAPTPTPTPTASAPAPAPVAQNNTPPDTTYLTDPDYLKVKNGAATAGDYGRTPGGIVKLSSGKLLA